MNKGLSLSLSQFRGLFDGCPIAAVVVTSEGSISDFNRAVTELTGYSRGDLEKNTDIRLWLEKLLQRRITRRTINEVFKNTREETVKTKGVSFSIVRKNGEKRHVECSMYYIPGNEKQPVYFVVVAFDMTENKRVLDVMKETDEKFSALYYRSLDFVYLHDLEGRFIDANPTALRLLGYKRKEISKLDFIKVIIEEQKPKALTVIEEIKTTGTQKELAEFSFRRKNGEFVYVETNGSLIFRDDKPIAILGIGRDITDRKKAMELENRYINKMDFLAKSAMELVQVSSEDNIYKAISNKLKEIAGNAVVTVASYDNENDIIETKAMAGLKKGIDTFIRLWGRHPVGMSYKVDRINRKSIATGKLIKIEGGLHQLSMGTVPKHVCKTIEVFFSIGDIYGIGYTSKGRIHGVTTIITLKRSEPLDTELVETFCNQASVTLQNWLTQRALRNSEEKYHSLAESINDILYSLDEKGIITFIGPQIKRYGFVPEEIISRHFVDFILPADAELATSDFANSMETGEEHPTQFRVKDKKGRIHWVENNATLQRDETGNIIGMTGILRDITQRKKTEEALRVSEAKLREQKEALVQKNIALREIIGQIEIEKNTIKKDISANVEEIILPILKKIQLREAPNEYLMLLQHLLDNLTSSFGNKIINLDSKLTPREVEICAMIKNGLANKEISRLLNISKSTVENHRKNIRMKLRISMKNINLRTYLQQL